MKKERKPAKHKWVDTPEGKVIFFYCDLSGAVLAKSSPVQGESGEEELEKAWRECEGKINFCPRCGRNVMDAMYNADAFLCVKCKPWQKPPVYCSTCGKSLRKNNRFCNNCGKRISMEGVDEHAD